MRTEPPSGVNLTALVIRFVSTWPRRCASPSDVRQLGVVDDELDPGSLRARRRLLDGLGDEAFEIGLAVLDPEAPGLDPGQHQQVANEAELAARVAVDHLEELAAFLAEALALDLGEELGVADDRNASGVRSSCETRLKKSSLSRSATFGGDVRGPRERRFTALDRAAQLELVDGAVWVDDAVGGDEFARLAGVGPHPIGEGLAVLRMNRGEELLAAGRPRRRLEAVVAEVLLLDHSNLPVSRSQRQLPTLAVRCASASWRRSRSSARSASIRGVMSTIVPSAPVRSPSAPARVTALPATQTMPPSGRR